MAVGARACDIRGFLGDYLRQKGINVRRHFRCVNPAHEDKHPSMSYNPAAENVHCFSCGVTYDLFDLIGLDYGLTDFPSRLGKAAELFGVNVLGSSVAGRPGAVWRPKLVASHSRDEELERMMSGADGSIDYFLSRGVTEDTCRRHKLFQKDGRAWFPVFRRGRCVGWSGRAVVDGVEPRYLNSAGHMELWNGDLLEVPPADSNGAPPQPPPKGRVPLESRRTKVQDDVIYVAEGIIDAICLEQEGKRAVALCGCQNVDKLLRVVRDNGSAGRRFIACGDPDAAGRRMNAALKEGLAAMGISCGAVSLDKGDVGELYVNDRVGLQRRLKGALDALEATSAVSLTSAADMLGEFFERSAKRAGERVLSTGLPALDKVLDGGLHPGLYVLGAISSLGKTSLMLQIADHMAKQGRDVLFFSLEQDCFELMAKSLSRISAELDGGRSQNAFTARQLLSGQAGDGNLYRRELLRSASEAYEKLARRLFIHEGISDIGVKDIAQKVKEHAEARGEKPVVIVDYLQILAPADPRATDKQNVDRAVTALKRLSRDYDIPVVAVSSFNRENYRTSVSMEAFKESGAVEYSADVLLGMQLKGAGQKDFDVNAAKSRERREIELVMLKNRSGVPYAKVDLKYRAMFGMFA